MRYNEDGELITEDSLYYKEHGTYYEAQYACSECKYKFSVVSEVNPKKARCPECPQCAENSAAKGVSITKGRLKTKKQLAANSKDMITSRKAAYIGGKGKGHKAHDETMKMVMEDYGLTDINDRPHEGENCVPKLPHHLEKQVNAGFGANFGAAPKLTSNINASQITSVGMQQINSGKFRDQGDVVAMQQKFGPKPKYRFINE